VLGLSWPKGLAPDPRLPMPGTVAMRALRKTLARNCRRHPSAPCTAVVRALARDEAAVRVSIDENDHLRVVDQHYEDAYPAAFFEWKNEKWAVYQVGMISAESPIPSEP
jgi:hypothetical protein